MSFIPNLHKQAGIILFTVLFTTHEPLNIYPATSLPLAMQGQWKGKNFGISFA